MITKSVWDGFIDIYSKPSDYFSAVFLSVFTIIADLIFSPLEIIAFIIYKINKNRKENIKRFFKNVEKLENIKKEEN